MSQLPVASLFSEAFERNRQARLDGLRDTSRAQPSAA